MSVEIAKTIAEQLVEEFGYTKPPVNVEKIAKARGLMIIREPLEDNIAGLLITEDSQSFCVINKKDGKKRQRFTIGHELGHLILGHQQVSGEHVHVDRGNFISMRGPRSTQGIDSKEVEANQFAASILMPEKLISEAVEEICEPLTDDKVSGLAELFDVSEQAMTIRLARLGYL